jgi:hypothetical protein
MSGRRRSPSGGPPFNAGEASRFFAERALHTLLSPPAALVHRLAWQLTARACLGRLDSGVAGAADVRRRG